MQDWLSFSTWYRWLHLKSNNHLYLGWHQSEGANNPVNIGDECSQHWAVVLARKKSMRAEYFQLVSIEPKGGKVCCPQLKGSNNHSELRLAIRPEGGVLSLFASGRVSGCACANEPNRGTSSKFYRVHICWETPILPQRFIDFPSLCPACYAIAAPHSGSYCLLRESRSVGI